MSERHSGWYDDPDDPDQLRYWDGILWTERRMPKTKPGLDGSRIGTPSRYDTPPPDQPATQGSSAEPQNPYAAPPSQTPSQPWQPPAQQQPQQSWQQQPTQQGPWQPPRPTGLTTPDGQRVSGWWRRFAAWLIDSIVVGIVAAVIAWPWTSDWFSRYQAYVDDALRSTSDGNSLPEVPQDVATLPIAWLISVLVVYAVYEIGLVTSRGRTLGKVVTGISVRPVHEARKPTFDEALRRFGIKGIAAILNPIPLLSGLGTIFTIVNGLWPIGDKGNQAIHDKVARTVVVIGPSTGNPPATTAPSPYPPQQF